MSISDDLYDAIAGPYCYTHQQYEKLRAENERLRAALRLIAGEEMRYAGDVVDIARKALHD